MFDDKKAGTFKGAKLETTLSGLPGLMDTLKKHNGQNRGIYFVVNYGGHEDAEITRINAQFMECDELSLDEQLDQIEAFPLEPSFIVKTRKSLHTYWLVRDARVEDFRRVQKGLAAKFGGDKTCINESRVLRLPGFYHCKQGPVMVECIHFRPELRYTQEELERHLPRVEDEPAPPGVVPAKGTNAYAQVIRNGRGEVAGLYPLMPAKMTVDRDSGGNLYYLYSRGSDDAPEAGENGQVYLPPDQVLHIPGLGYDGIVGYSPIAMAKNAVGLGIATEEYGAKFFANDASPSGILEHPGVLKNPDKVRESWNKLFRGSVNSHQIAVLEEGLKYQPIGISPDQAQFLETRKFQLNEIARIFRVPPHMVGDLEKSSFSNIEQQSLEFVKYTLEPWLMRWEQAMGRRLFTESEKESYFMKKAVALLDEVKESIINAYEIKTGLSRAKLSHLMDAETWLSAHKAVELGFADGLLFGERAEVPEGAADFVFSRRAVTNSLLEKLPRRAEKRIPAGPLYGRLDLLKM